MKNKYGYEASDWENAKNEARSILIEIAKQRGRIAYSDLTPRIETIQFDYDDPRFGWFLGEISEEELKAGRGMLSAIVVHKHGDMIPGPGFYDLAKRLGKKFQDIDRFWLQEFNKVHDVWANKKA